MVTAGFDADVLTQQEPMYQFIDEVLSTIGPRESCSTAERKLGERVAAAWEKLGFEVRREPYSCHPAAFLAGIPIGAIMYAIAVVLYWYQPAVAGLVSLAFLALVFFQSLNYRRILDPLFAKGEGVNVAAVVPSRGECVRRVVVNAHLDSAYEFTLWYRLKNAASPLMVIGALAAFVPLMGGVVALTGWGSDSTITNIGWVAVGLLPFVLSFLFFRSSRSVPGAMDDLAGVAVLMGLGDVMAGSGALKDTELVILATGAEEAGLRGAMSWANKHRAEIESVPTYAIVIDGVYDESFLRVMTNEVLAFVKHDAELVSLAKRVAAARDWTMTENIVPLGASDGTAFHRAGMKTALLMCQDTSRFVPNYHTRNDVLEYIRPISLTVMLQVVKDMVVALDGGQSRSASSAGV